MEHLEIDRLARKHLFLHPVYGAVVRDRTATAGRHPFRILVAELGRILVSPHLRGGVPTRLRVHFCQCL